MVIVKLIRLNIPTTLAALFLLLVSTMAAAQSRPFVKTGVAFRDSLLPELQLELTCGPGDQNRHRVTVNADQWLEITIPESIDRPATCSLSALPPLGYTVRYAAQAPGSSLADPTGCHFEPLSASGSYTCEIVVSVDPVPLTVYKKWIGPSGRESDVQIILECESGDYSGVRYVNEGFPNGWQVGQVPPDGVLCNVTETVRETFRPDIIDCQGLWLRPGRGEECTLVNTKIVKRIEMLNRYGAVVMGVLVLAIGLLAVRRLV